MGENSKIEWTDATWNPVRGCSVVSEGCRNCYAMTVAARFSGKGPDGKDLPYAGLAYRNGSGAHWTGKVKLIEEHLNDPLRWKKPRRIFVNSMSDLFHEGLSDEEIISVFNVMRRCPQHTFQILTKRPDRMRDFCQRLRFDGKGAGRMWLVQSPSETGGYRLMGGNGATGMPWVWLGVSCEDQKTADERIPLLLETPAAVRWISAEPLLGPIDLANLKSSTLNALDGIDFENVGDIRDAGILSKSDIPSLDWVVVGGESGAGARPMHLAWAETIIKQCKAVGVPVFCKQLGAIWAKESKAKNGKGGDPSEWPYQEILNVREVPKAVTVNE